jgi:uncharacterized membrane protein YphA (DoxX/SURF4 family)
MVNIGNRTTAAVLSRPNGELRGKASASTPWNATAASVSAVVLSLLFLASGIWKLLDLNATAERMVQSLAPVAFSMPVAMVVPVLETFAGILLLIPRYRRWGAWLAATMLIAFMICIGILYDRLLGDDCNCFPWIRRVVGPAFFAGDVAMLCLAAVAGWWSVKPRGWRPAAVLLAAVCSLTLASYAASVVRRNQAEAPGLVTVDGKLIRLRDGKALLYFFDPECTHCYAMAGEMGTRDWGSTRVVVVPTREPQFATAFLETAKLKAGICTDADLLRSALPFTDPPYAVALDHGRVAATFNSGQMEDASYYDTLRRLGHLK